MRIVDGTEHSEDTVKKILHTSVILLNAKGRDLSAEVVKVSLLSAGVCVYVCVFAVRVTLCTSVAGTARAGLLVSPFRFPFPGGLDCSEGLLPPEDACLSCLPRRPEGGEEEKAPSLRQERVLCFPTAAAGGTAARKPHP